MITALVVGLERLAGAGVGVAVQSVAGSLDPLWAQEQPAIARAIPSRIAEFTAGRMAARAAMQVLGLPKAAILMGPDRAPIWPKGAIGSIAHTDGICAALVARVGPITAIGVDLELNHPLAPELWVEVCSATEMADLYNLPEPGRGKTAKLIFSAKECVYKCIYPQIQTVIGFQALEIRPDPAGQSFKATLLQQAGPFAAGTVWRGSYALVQGLIVTVLVLR